MIPEIAVQRMQIPLTNIIGLLIDTNQMNKLIVSIIAISASNANEAEKIRVVIPKILSSINLDIRRFPNLKPKLTACILAGFTDGAYHKPAFVTNLVRRPIEFSNVRNILSSLGDILTFFLTGSARGRGRDSLEVLTPAIYTHSDDHDADSGDFYILDDIVVWNIMIKIEIQGAYPRDAQSQNLYDIFTQGTEHYLREAAEARNFAVMPVAQGVRREQAVNNAKIDIFFKTIRAHIPMHIMTRYGGLISEKLRTMLVLLRRKYKDVPSINCLMHAKISEIKQLSSVLFSGQISEVIAVGKIIKIFEYICDFLQLI